jgi:hypothetical protein
MNIDTPEPLAMQDLALDETQDFVALGHRRGRQMISRQTNTTRMHEFITQVSDAHVDECIVMVVDSASSHMVENQGVPQNMQLPKLPPCAPEFNPREHAWDELREKALPNGVFADLASVRARLDRCLPRLAVDCATLFDKTAS